MVEDSLRIGGYLNAKSRAFGDTTGTNPTTGWIAGTQHTTPAGANRLRIIGLIWEKGPVDAAPLSFSACTYGGQSCTQIASVSATNASEPEVHVSAWYCNEAALAAATNTTIACTPDETPQGARPVITLTSVYTGINQGAPITDSDTKAEGSSTSVATPALTTTNPGVAVMVGGSGSDGPWTVGSGWTEQADVGEDTSVGTRGMAADRNTTGDTPTPSATFASVDSTRRLALVAFSLNGGEEQPPNPPEIVTRTQAGSRCALHNEAAYEWLGSQNTPCTVVPGHHLLVVSEYHVSGAMESTLIGKHLQCCTASCTDNDNWWAVDNAGTNGIRYAASTVFPHLTPIASRLLSGAACTHVAGGIVTQDSMLAQALDEGECSTVGHVIQVMPTVTAPSTFTCRLALDDNTPLNVYSQTTTISVIGGKASGQ
jgi:hypothetical protein